MQNYEKIPINEIKKIIRFFFNICSLENYLYICTFRELSGEAECPGLKSIRSLLS